MKVKSTSRAAHDSIRMAKPYYWEKIIDGLEKLKVGGTFAEIGDMCRIPHDKIWKRLSELEKDGKIYNTGLTRKLPSGRVGTVWQIVGLVSNGETPFIEKKSSKKKEIVIPNNPLFTSVN